MTLPRPIREPRLGEASSRRSTQRKNSGMNARYRKKRWRFWRMNGKRRLHPVAPMDRAARRRRSPADRRSRSGSRPCGSSSRSPGSRAGSTGSGSPALMPGGRPTSAEQREKNGDEVAVDLVRRAEERRPEQRAEQRVRRRRREPEPRRRAARSTSVLAPARPAEALRAVPAGLRGGRPVAEARRSARHPAVPTCARRSMIASANWLVPAVPPRS